MFGDYPIPDRCLKRLYLAGCVDSSLFGNYVPRELSGGTRPSLIVGNGFSASRFSPASPPGSPLGTGAELSTVHPIIDGFLTALGAFVVTWTVAFLVRLTNAPVALFHEQKDRADRLEGLRQIANEVVRPCPLT